MSEQRIVEASVITNVYVWQNGMVMTFDQFGQQMPEYQGEAAEVLPKIKAVFSGTIFEANWFTGHTKPRQSEQSA